MRHQTLTALVAVFVLCGGPLYAFADGELVTTVSVVEKASVTTANYPLTLSLVFKQGDVASNVTARNNDVLGYVVIESRSGTMSGVSYWTALGSDIVRGPGNSPPYTYNPGASGTVTVGVATMAAMDGGNGGWAALYGASPVGASHIALVADEDQANDAERSHTTEQVGYIVFAD